MLALNLMCVSLPPFPLNRFYEREVGHVEEGTLEDIGSKICTIDQFVFQNKEGFRKIVKKYVNSWSLYCSSQT